MGNKNDKGNNKTPLISSNPNMNRGNTPSNPVNNKGGNNGGNNGNKGNNNGNKGKNDDKGKDKDKGPDKPNKPGKTGGGDIIMMPEQKTPKMKGPVPDNTDYLGNIPEGYTKKTRGNWRSDSNSRPPDRPFFKHKIKGN